MAESGILLKQITIIFLLFFIKIYCIPLPQDIDYNYQRAEVPKKCLKKITKHH